MAAGGRAAPSRFTFWLTVLQIRFSRKVVNLRASNFTHAFFRVSAFVMPCSLQLVSNFWVINAFLEIGIFFFFFSQISVYLPKLQKYSRYLDEPL